MDKQEFSGYALEAAKQAAADNQKNHGYRDNAHYNCANAILEMGKDPNLTHEQRMAYVEMACKEVDKPDENAKERRVFILSGLKYLAITAVSWLFGTWITSSVANAKRK